MKLFLSILFSLRIKIKRGNLIIKIRGVSFILSEKDLLINTEGVMGFNSDLEEIKQFKYNHSRNNNSQSIVMPLKRPRHKPVKEKELDYVSC